MPATKSTKQDVVPLRITPATRRQLDRLADAGHGNQAEIIRTAIDRMYKEEIKMSAVKILSVQTKPEVDPYRADTNGESTTTLYIDPQARAVWVQQDYPGQNGIPEHIYHHRTLAYDLDPRPDQAALKTYLAGEDAKALLDRICAGHAIDWNGSNMIGTLTDDAAAAVEELTAAIAAEVDDSAWQLWDIDDWFNGSVDELTAETTDEELDDLIAAYETMAETDCVELNGDIREYLTKRRAELIEEAAEE